METTRVYKATTTSVSALRANLKTMGVKSFVRVLPNGKARVTITTKQDREATRDALVLTNCAGPTGMPFTDQDTARYSWQDLSIFVWFLSENGL